MRDLGVHGLNGTRYIYGNLIITCILIFCLHHTLHSGRYPYSLYIGVHLGGVSNPPDELPFFNFRCQWMWGVCILSRKSQVSQHERIVPMHVQRRICWGRRGVCWGHSVQTGKKQTTGLNDRRRSWRRNTFNHRLDSVLLLYKKVEEKGGERRNYRGNGSYTWSLWTWVV